MTERAQHSLELPDYLRGPLTDQQATTQQEIIANLVRTNPTLVKVSILWVSLNSYSSRETVLSTLCAP